MGAWMYVGFAIRMAEGLELGIGDDKPPHLRRRLAASASTTFPTTAAETEAGSRTNADARLEAAPRPGTDLPDLYREGTGTVSQNVNDKRGAKALEEIATSEVRRRTMFSCFVLDRMLACGKNRSAMIRSENVKIQLPCSEIAFDLSFETFTGYLRPRPEIGIHVAGPPDSGEVASDVNDSLLARFNLLVDIWGEISEYSFAGGRHTEEQPPWEESKFRRLRGNLESFYAHLPSTFTFSTANYHKHENHNASTEYVSLHMLFAVCQIMLHREYTPFIPIRCMRPMGPLDEPTFPEGSAPRMFWEQSADTMFEAAYNIIELIEICQTRKQMPMSALVVFAVWTAAFVGIYAWHFPRMDKNHHMVTQFDAERNGRRGPVLSNNDDRRVSTHGPTAAAFEALKSMGTWLQMATTYVKYFHEMDEYYEGVKKEYWVHVEKHGGETGRHKSVRQGGNDGGLDEWKVHGPKVMNIGKISAAEEAGSEGVELPADGNKRDRDNANKHIAPEPRLVESAKTSSSQLRRTAVDGSSSYSNTQDAIGQDGGEGPRQGHQQQQQQQQENAIDENTAVDGGEGATTVATAVPGNSLQGILYGGENAAQFAGDDIDNGVDENNNGSGAMQAIPEEQWDQFAQHAQEQHPAQMYAQGPLSQTQASSSNFSPEDCLPSDVATDFQFDLFYPPLADVEPYVSTLEGKRWQDASQAVGIERFSQAELDGPAVWGASYFGAEYQTGGFQS
ncbi:c6 zinc finger domain containing protein [Sporothrix brasiliensis 5110]|uniref:C6 zinc finger domain containing protein n=1 Tax=Sporothrix brasiliensis 5110 TaxID=1398154 RepID=A0A0C2II87_9PEZI|nr:c6 zinc finger domain containing protein [Sporothrix brasiliensis 5110]KIH88911.1 c6 zinc finger domain containing protein [Sporothrix brasiliensis 5110]